MTLEGLLKRKREREKRRRCFFCGRGGRVPARVEKKKVKHN